MSFIKISEQSSLYDNLEQKSVHELLVDMNTEDKKVALAVEKAIPQIEALVEKIIPTFGVPPTMVYGLIAGGDTALRTAVENAEDDTQHGWVELEEHGISEDDTVIGIAASGTTPYVIGALKEARAHGILTGCITSNPDSPMAAACEHPIEMIVGPEFVTGSSRMKSGTGQKMILNMISTSIMIKLGRVKGNRMVNMQLTNQKLVDRGTRMIVDELGLPYDEAKELLLKHHSVKRAITAYRNAAK